MNKQIWIVVLVVISLAIVCVINFAADDMLEVKFRIGKNIHETAKQSGAPKYATRNVAGLVSYKLIDLPSDIALVYDVPDYEINSLPIFAFTLYADKENDNNLAVEAASLQFNTDKINSHESAKAFVERLIAKFNRAKSKRFVADLCPAVTGRSSFLNEAENVDQIWNCPLDPKHQIAMDDLVKLMVMTQNFQWVGDGVLATLTVGFSNDSHGITYLIRLEFEDFAIKTRRENTSEHEELQKGDDEGKNSSAKHIAELVRAKARIASLEENAVRRGDTLLIREHR